MLSAKGSDNAEPEVSFTLVSCEVVIVSIACSNSCGDWSYLIIQSSPEHHKINYHSSETMVWPL